MPVDITQITETTWSLLVSDSSKIGTFVKWLYLWNISATSNNFRILFLKIFWFLLYDWQPACVPPLKTCILGKLETQYMAHAVCSDPERTIPPLLLCGLAYFFIFLFVEFILIWPQVLRIDAVLWYVKRILKTHVFQGYIINKIFLTCK